MEETTNNSINPKRYSLDSFLEMVNEPMVPYDYAPTGSTQHDVYIPFKIDVLRGINERIKSVRNVDVKTQLEEFINIFTQIISARSNELLKKENIPQVHFAQMDDNSVMIEWGTSDFKMGFSFEPNKYESGWFLVSNKNLDTSQQSGSLRSEIYSELINFALSYVTANT